MTEEATLKTVLEVWRSVLGTESGPDEVFYQLGGTSLTAAQVAARLQAVTGRRVPMRVVLRDAITARQLACWMDNSARAEGGDARPPLLDAAVEAEDTEPAPITVQQEAIWFLEQLDPQNVAYNTLSAVWLAGPLQIKVLKEALAEPIRRHPLLRATFPTRDGWPVQLVHSADEAAPVLEFIDLPHSSNEQVTTVLRELGRHQFDIRRLPLIRWTLLRLGPQQHVLAQVEHHFLHDGWSMWIVLSELAASYRALATGQSAELPELELTYEQVARWQRRWLSSEAAQQQRHHWVNLLRDAPTVLKFGHDNTRPPYFDYRGQTVETRLSQPDLRTVREAARRHSVTPFSVLMAAFVVTLGDTNGCDGLTLGSMLRNRRLPGSEGVVGMFVNTVALPFPNWTEKTFGQLIEDLHAMLIDAQEHQEFPFPVVVRDLALPKQLSRNPLFQVCFSMNDWPETSLNFGEDLTVRVTFPSNGGAKFDLDVVVLPDRDGYSMLWRYYAALFSESEVADLAAVYQTVLATVTKHHSEPLGDLLAAPRPVAQR